MACMQNSFLGYFIFAQQAFKTMSWWFGINQWLLCALWLHVSVCNKQVCGLRCVKRYWYFILTSVAMCELWTYPTKTENCSRLFLHKPRSRGETRLLELARVRNRAKKVNSSCFMSKPDTVCRLYRLSYPTPSTLLDNIWVVVTVWRLRGNIIRTALCWIVWHSVHSLQHTLSLIHISEPTRPY